MARRHRLRAMALSIGDRVRVAAMRRDRPAPRGKPAAREKRDLARIAGLAAVRALFATAPERAERLFFVPELRAEAEDLCRQMAMTRKPYRQVGAEELARVAGT